MWRIYFFLAFINVVYAANGFEGRPITNNISMPTGFTLNKGEFQLGIGPLGFGLSDRVQVGTNVLDFIFGNPNANMRWNFINADYSMMAGVSFASITTEISNENVTYGAVFPFLAYSRPVGSNTLLHLSARLGTFSGDQDIQESDPEFWLQGSALSAGIEYSYSISTKFLAETGYDFTFDGLRLAGAVLWGWNTFRFKLGLEFYDPEMRQNAFFTPIVGLWWRFGGRK